MLSLNAASQFLSFTVKPVVGWSVVAMGRRG